MQFIDAESIERQARLAWERSADIRAEFVSFNTYHAFCKYEADMAEKHELHRVRNPSVPTPSEAALDQKAEQLWNNNVGIRAEFKEFSTFRAYYVNGGWKDSGFQEGR